MKFSENFFRFPVKIYTDKDWNSVEKSIELNTEIEEPPYYKGTHYCLIDEIVNISSSCSAFDSADGSFAPRSLITLRNGRVYFCLWSVDKFIEKLDKFAEDLENKNIEEQIIKIKKKLEENLTELVKEYEKNNIKIIYEQDGTIRFEQIEKNSRNTKAKG